MPETIAQSEILVLGGGPAGTAAAIHLAHHGRAVILVERDAAPRHKVCGEFLSAEALHLLSSLGLSHVLAGAHAIRRVRLASRRRITEADLPFPAQSLTRRCLDASLLKAAEAAGVIVLRGSAVESLTHRLGAWQAVLSTGHTLSAPQVILATGKHDIRGFPRPEGKQNDLVALKMYLRLTPEQAERLEHTVELHLHALGYTGLQPVEDGCANLTALVRRDHLASLGGWPGLMADLKAGNPHAAQRLGGAEPLLEKPLAISSIPYGFVREKALALNLYAVGDQAAVIPSFTGDGMSIALYSGIAAAEAILRAEPATSFQPRLRHTLKGQVARATILSRSLVHPMGKHVLTTLADLWPASLQTVARLTRIPAAALFDGGG